MPLVLKTLQHFPPLLETNPTYSIEKILATVYISKLLQSDLEKPETPLLVKKTVLVILKTKYIGSFFLSERGSIVN